MCGAVQTISVSGPFEHDVANVAEVPNSDVRLLSKLEGNSPQGYVGLVRIAAYCGAQSAQSKPVDFFENGCLLWKP